MHGAEEGIANMENQMEKKANSEWPGNCYMGSL